MQGTMPGAYRRGRPHTAWMDNIKTWTGLSVEESIRMTEDRDKWRKYVHGVANRRIEQNVMFALAIFTTWRYVLARYILRPCVCVCASQVRDLLNVWTYDSVPASLVLSAMFTVFPLSTTLRFIASASPVNVTSAAIWITVTQKHTYNCF